MTEKNITDNSWICQGKRRINVDKAIHLWTNKHYSANMIAKELGFSRAGVIKCLNRHGIDTGKDHRVIFDCPQCGNKVEQRKAYARKHKKHFCSFQCYMDSLENPHFKEWRHGTRIARNVIAEHIELPPGSIAHHIDSDQRNNTPENLMLFHNQSDHMKWHRTQDHDVNPIFVGSSTS